MSLPACLRQLQSSIWKGPSRLHQSWLPENDQVQTCESELSISGDSDSARVDYTWEYQGETQKGYMDIAGNRADNLIRILWTDTWHQSDSAMELTGPFNDANISGLGSYGDEETGRWGWRIDLRPEGDKLSLKMTNIDPDGTEHWAVDASYSPF